MPGAPSATTVEAGSSVEVGIVTTAVLQDLRDALGWGLAAAIPDTAWAEVAPGVDEEWSGPHGPVRHELSTVVDVHQLAATQGQDVAVYLRELHQPELVAVLRADGRPWAQRLIELYDDAHPPLAPGDPPLTQEVADSYLAILSFVDALMEHRAWTPLEEATRRQFTDQMARQYPGLDPAQQAWLATLPLEWARTRHLWQSGGEPSRSRFRELLVDRYGATARATPALAEGPRISPAMPVVGDGVPAPSPDRDGLPPTQALPQEAGGRLEQRELELQKKLQDQVARAAMLSNIMKMQHQATMSWAQSLGRI